MAPRVSVVLAVYNGAEHLSASIQSIVDQTFRDFELIVIDDGSTDSTPGIVDAFARADDRIRVVRHDNQGLTASLNEGIGAAVGHYVARQDADDVSVAVRFERQVEFLDSHALVAAVGSGASVIDGDDHVVGALPALQGAHAVRTGLLGLRATPVHGSMMMRRTAIDAARGYRPAFPVSQDYDLWLRLSEASEIDNLAEILYHWRLNRHSVYATRRAVQLKYAAIALAFAQERARRGADSYQLLEECAGDLDRFVSSYRLAPLVLATWGELLLRALGNSAIVRRYLRSAIAGGHRSPWTVGLCAWTHLGLPWPGGHSLAAAEGPAPL